MEKTSKPKLKAKWSDSPLFWQSKYEFIAPCDFEECIQRINTLGIKYWDENQEVWRLFFPQPQFGINSQQDNGGVFNFKMSGSESRGLAARLLGNLIYDNNQQTRVKVRTGFTWGSTLGLTSLLPFFFVMLIIVTHASNGFEIAICFGISAALFGIIALIQLISSYSLKAQLYFDLWEALSIKTAPRPTNLPI